MEQPHGDMTPEEFSVVELLAKASLEASSLPGLHHEHFERCISCLQDRVFALGAKRRYLEN